MASLPDPLDLGQLRTQAKELKRAFLEGDQAAVDRIFAWHPKFAGRPPERLEGWPLSLRDAQVTIARELGFESWKALAAAVEGEPVMRWASRASFDIQTRAFGEATKLGHSFCTTGHFLLALLDPPHPTAASEVLGELGLAYDRVAERVAGLARRRRKPSWTSSTPAFQFLLGWAHGIAIGMGSASLTDEHVLLALAYGDLGGGSDLVWFDIDPDEVVAGLRAHGVPTPSMLPPVAPPPIGPWGPWVYFPKEDWSAVTQELAERHPPGTAEWGTNRSKWKKGHWYVHGEDEIAMAEIVRSAVKDKATVEVLAETEGGELENANAPRRYRERPHADS